MTGKTLGNAFAERPCRRLILPLAALGLFLCASYHPAAGAQESWQHVPKSSSTSPAQDGKPQAYAPPLCMQGFTAVNIRSGLPEIKRLQDTRDDILARHVPEVAFHKNSELLPPPVREQWSNLLKLMPSISKEKKLRYINGFFNSWPSKKDIDNYGVEEYWAIPEEFLVKGGDCEDYAIVKYFALKYLSWPPEDMWILLVFGREKKDQHAVLVVRDGDKTFVLDNLSKPAYLLIPEHIYLKTFIPLFAINEQGIWMFVRSKEPAAPGDKENARCDAQ